MEAASDDLTRPLGTRTAGPVVPGWLRPWPVYLSSLVLAAAGCAIGYAALFGDAAGGLPRVSAPIGAAPPTPAIPPPDPQVAGAPGAGRQKAGEVESASGVSVVRPPGTGVADAVIIRVPDATDLKPAEPDGRLLERTRFGSLPRIGPGGVKPIDAYARPVGDLPDGAVPVGRVAIVVGGLGIGQTATAAALAKLPPAVTLAIAPYGGDLDGLARRARDTGHEIMLQVPMEPFDYPDSDPGPHTLLASAKPADNVDHLNWALGRFSGYVGVVNYMGAKVTADERALRPILKEIGGRGLGFLDDGSSSRSVAPSLAAALPMARADAVVDALPRADAIDAALARLERVAAGGKVAVGTASALPLSVERIDRWARTLAAKGLLLVPVTTAFRDNGTASR